MTKQELIILLDSALQGHTPFQDLLQAVSETALTDPAEAGAFLEEIETWYARGELRYDAYLSLKDQLSVAAPRTTRPPPSPRTVLRPPAGSNERDAGADGGVTSAPAAREADRPGRTVLRAPTGPTPRHVSGRPRTSPTGSLMTGSKWEDAEDWTLVVEQPLEPGSVIKNRFVLEERVGEGGMGVVFRARDMRKEEAQDRNTAVAIKFLGSEFRKHPEALKALSRETRRAQTLAHPNIVTVYDFDRDGTLIYMTMEYLDGEPLDRFIQRHPQGVRFSDAWPIIEGAGRALMYAHEQGVVHADFKPGNVFVLDGQKGKVAKVLDFGIARALVAPGDVPQGTRFDPGSLGALTPAYASPEMLLNEEPDPRDDVYALACVAYELLTGRHPFDGATAVKAAHDGLKLKRTPGMGRRQFKAISRALAFRQNDRTATVEAFLDELAGPFGMRGRAVRQIVVSTGLTATLVAAAAVGIWWFAKPDPDEVFMRSLMKDAKARVEAEQAAMEPGSWAPDLDLLDSFLAQGADYLYLAQQPFNPGLLSEGVSSAYGAFTEALAIDPDNRQAAEGILEIVRIYETEAQRVLDAGYFDKAAEIAGYGLKVAPGRESLEEIKAEAEKELRRSQG